MTGVEIMHAAFPSYYSPTSDEFKQAWATGVFALDANVLLNLYRYPRDVSLETLRVLNLAKDRLFVPHHAALEYQRNRLSVIAEQKGRYVEVRKVVEALVHDLAAELDKLQVRERHPVIDPDTLIKSVEPAAKSYLEELSKAELEQADVFDDDPIRNALDELLAGRVGPAPTQDWVNSVDKEGEARYLAQIPPGYLDASKDKATASRFGYGGVMYARQYGDLYVWKQVLDHAKKGTKSVVFITDDAKEDWYWHVHSQGPKRIGPRPELVDEFRRETGAALFHAYSSGQFLKNSTDYLKSGASETAIELVRTLAVSPTSPEDIRALSYIAEHAVAEWFSATYPGGFVLHQDHGWPDMIVHRPDGEKIGVEVIVVRSLLFLQRAEERAYRAFHGIQKGQFASFELALVLRESELTPTALGRIGRLRGRVPEGVTVRLFRLYPDEELKSGHAVALIAD